MGLIKDKLDYWCQHAVDIREHLTTLKEYSSECRSITEMGVRSIVSTWALLAGKPERMVSIDICHPSFYGANLEEVISSCVEEKIDFKFIQASTLDIVIEETDLLFIDTLHTYDQLKQELFLHGNKSNKFLILHDTESCKEMVPAIHEFIQNNPIWKIKKIFENNNGLTILEKSSA
jgi:hypothetical protein